MTRVTILILWSSLAIAVVPAQSTAQNVWNVHDGSVLMESPRSVDFFDRDHGIVVGDMGQIRVTVDGGQTWMSPNSGTEESLRSVSTMSPGRAISVGWGNTVLLTEDWGASWQAADLGAIAGIAFENSSFVNDMTGFIVGNNTDSEARFDIGYLLATNDGGETWTRQATSIDVRFLLAIHFIDENSGVVAGLNGVATTTDGGTVWTPQFASGANFRDAQLVSSEVFVGASDDGVVRRSSDAGASWQVVLDADAYHMRDIEFLDEQVGFVVGSWGVIPEVIFQTVDGAATWEDTGPDGSNFGVNYYGISFTDIDNGWAVGSYVDALDNTVPVLLQWGQVQTAVEDGALPHETELSVRAWPNPTSGSLRVSVSSGHSGRVDIHVFDMLGRLVQSHGDVAARPDAETEIHLRNLPAGLYLVRARSAFSSASELITLIE